jgi:hypothetical protein
MLGGALELLELAAVEVEEAQRHALGMHHQLALRAVHHVRAHDARLHQHGLTGGRRLGRNEHRLVLVAQR